jgi:hypothetical protein
LGGYDTRVQAPTEEEVRRTARALVLGVLLGVLLLLLARKTRRG